MGSYAESTRRTKAGQEERVRPTPLPTPYPLPEAGRIASKHSGGEGRFFQGGAGAKPRPLLGGFTLPLRGTSKCEFPTCRGRLRVGVNSEASWGATVPRLIGPSTPPDRPASQIATPQGGQAEPEQKACGSPPRSRLAIIGGSQSGSKRFGPVRRKSGSREARHLDSRAEP